MAFDLLFVIHLVIAAVALLRLRPATFLVAGNQLSPLRAFSNIAEFGQPRSQGFLPASVFSNENLDIAAALFTVQALLLAVCALLPDSKAPEERSLPALPRPLAWILGAYFVAIIFSSRTIFTNPHGDPARMLIGLNLSGAHALLASLVLYEVTRRVRARLWRPVAAFAFLLGLFIATDYVKGSTGFATGYVVTGAMLFFREERGALRRWSRVGVALVGSILLALAVRGVRTTLYSEGVQAFSSFASSVRTQESAIARNAEGLEIFGNGAQYAAHIVECISLYDGGLSRQWRSIYRPLEYSYKPSFLIDALGLDRPKEAAWELAEYYIHGGGIFVLGEVYWNGGYACVLLVLAGILLLCWRADTASRSSFVWMLILCEYAPSLLQGIGYGFAQVSRGALNGLMLLAVYYAWRRLAGRRGAADEAGPPLRFPPPGAQPALPPAPGHDWG